MKKTIVLFVVFASANSGTFGQETNADRLKHYNLENKLALQGYDAVAYFTSGKAVKGKPEFSFDRAGVLYRFATKQNLELFKAEPSKYEPQYGGWCAYAMGNEGSKVEVDPGTFKITGGKLYLFYNFYFNNTLKKWNADETALEKSADRNWQKVLSK